MKKVEEDESGEASEPEDPMMLSRDPKDWKVCLVVVVLLFAWNSWLMLYDCFRTRTTTPF